MNINNDTVLRKKDHVIERKGEELLLFDSSSGKLFELNETGKAIWNMLNTQHTVEEIQKHIQQEFKKTGNIAQDLSNFIAKLLELNLIEIN